MKLTLPLFLFTNNRMVETQEQYMKTHIPRNVVNNEEKKCMHWITVWVSHYQYNITTYQI